MHRLILDFRPLRARRACQLDHCKLIFATREGPHCLVRVRGVTFLTASKTEFKPIELTYRPSRGNYSHVLVEFGRMPSVSLVKL